jgi:integrase
VAVKVREKIKGSGIFWIFINHDGKRKSKRIGDEETALDAARKIEARLVLGELDIVNRTPPKHRVSAIVGRWLSHVKATCRETTHRRYKGVYRMYVGPGIGHHAIEKLTRPDIVTFLRGLVKNGMSRSSAECCKNVISGICEFAIDEGILEHNPTRGTMGRLRLKKTSAKDTIEIFSRDEIEPILDQAKRYHWETYPVILTAFRAGLRLGEILGLDWSDINWRNGYMKIQRSWRNGVMTDTKTGKTRNVDMSGQLTDELKQLYTKRKKEAVAKGKPAPMQHIFSERNGKRLSQNSVRNVWKRVLRRCGLDYRKFHTTRHSFASHLISQGHPLEAVRDLLGHHSIQITVDVYGQFIPDGSGKIVDSLDAPKPHPIRTLQNKNAVTHEGHGDFSHMVAMQGFEPRTLRI